MTMLRSIAREPLVHFFALGTCLFLAHAAVGNAPDTSRGRIVVTRGQIEQLAAAFARTWQRPPTRVELDGLVEDWIRTEVAYRQARALGIDGDDVVVRRRLRQKLEFLTEDVTQAAPSDEELRAYMAAHADVFRTPARLTFSQIYLSPERRADAAADAGALLARLADERDLDARELGDPLLVPHELVDAAPSEVASVFGNAFADAVATAPVGCWSGPVESGYGIHLVFVRQRIAGGMPTLEEARSTVEREWQSARRTRVLDDAYARMRARYEIVVDSVASDAGEVAAR